MARLAHGLALAALVLASGCTTYGGVSSARVSGSTLSTSSASATVGTGGVSARSNRSEIVLHE